MANKITSDNGYLTDGAFDFSGGVDSSKVTTIQSDLNPNGIRRDQVNWANNATFRTIGILQRTGWQPLVRVADPDLRWQGGFIYEPDGENPYLVCSISGVIYRVLLEAPYTITNLSAAFGLFNPPNAEIAYFVQGENQLIIQAGDYFTPGTPVMGTTDASGHTLPLFWNGTTLRRSIGITTPAPAIAPGNNEIPAATAMDYYGNRIWYAQARAISGGDMVGALSGTPGERFRDAILNVTENPLCFAGDGFTVPTNAGNIRAIKHSANINAALGQGQLYIFTRKAIYQLTVPTTRTDWINADTNNQPRLDVIQLINGAVGDRCIVPVNGDLFYQSFEPSIRSLIRAVSNFGEGQWGNTPISQNEERALQFNDRALMRFSSGIEFNNRILQAILPSLAADGINVIHQAIAPLDFDIVTNLEQKKNPVWEGVWDGLQILQLHTGDFGGRQRAFASALNDDGSINIWELTVSDRFQNGDNRVTWGVEFPAFTWSTSGYEYRLKQLNGGELWIDKVSSTVDFDVYYRGDAEPCWRHWFHHQICAARCEDLNDALTGYPCEPTREGYVFTVAFPEPLAVCNQMQVRPTTIGYQFQVKIVLKGWCRIRGMLLYALPKAKPQFQGIACPPNPTSGGMAVLPNPFQVSPAATPIPSPIVPPTPQPPTPPTPTPLPPNKAVNPSPANGATGEDPAATILTWDDGGGADSFNVYLNGVLQGNQTTTSFNPGVLGPFASYTWRIDSINADGTTTGDTWSFSTGVHALVTDWANRVVINGGALPSVASQQTLSIFAQGLDSAGLMSKMIAVNCFAPDSLIAAITPLIVGIGNDPWTNSGTLFQPADISVAGLTDNDLNAYLNTGINPTTCYASNNDAGFTVYAKTLTTQCQGRIMCENPAGRTSAIYTDAVPAIYTGAYNTWDLAVAQPAGAVSKYYWCSANRTAVNAVSLYEANSIIGFVTVSSGVGAPGARPNDNMYLNCNNQLGAPVTFPNSETIYSFAAIHNGLTAGENQTLFNLVQTMRQSLGGGYD